MTKQSSKLSKINPLAILPYVIAAAISLAIGVIVFKAKEIAPFGSRSVLCMDLWGQYFPMYVNNVNAGSLHGTALSATTTGRRALTTATAYSYC